MYSKTSRDLNSHLVENFHHGTRAWVLVATQGWHIGGCKLQDVYTELFFKKIMPTMFGNNSWNWGGGD